MKETSKRWARAARASTHADHGLDQRRLPSVLVVRRVDVGPVSQRLRHGGQVLALGGLVEQRSGLKVPHLLRVGGVRLRLQTRPQLRLLLRLTAGVLGDLAL